MEKVTKIMYKGYDGTLYETEDECIKAEKEGLAQIIIQDDVGFPFQDEYGEAVVRLVRFRNEDDIESVLQFIKADRCIDRDVYGLEYANAMSFPCYMYLYDCHDWATFYPNKFIDDKLKSAYQKVFGNECYSFF